MEFSSSVVSFVILLVLVGLYLSYSSSIVVVGLGNEKDSSSHAISLPGFSFIGTTFSVDGTRPNIEGNRELQNVAPFCILLILRVFRAGEHIFNDSPLACGKNPPLSYRSGGTALTPL